MKLHTEEFRTSDLDIVDTARVVVLASGGPIMTVANVIGQAVLCRWEDGGVTKQATFPVSALRNLVPFDPSPWVN